VAIAIRDGPGLSPVCKGSHKSDKDDWILFDRPSEISSGEGSVVVFDSNIARKDPPVKDDGWIGIILLYAEDSIEGKDKAGS